MACKRKNCPETLTCYTVWEPDDVWSSVTLPSDRSWVMTPGAHNLEPSRQKQKMTEVIREQNTHLRQVSRNVEPFSIFVETVYQIISSRLNTSFFLFSELNSKHWSQWSMIIVCFVQQNRFMKCIFNLPKQHPAATSGFSQPDHECNNVTNNFWFKTTQMYTSRTKVHSLWVLKGKCN